ncbi:protein unc-93 homolog A-like isoform X2 [Mercenaria mercenaria]|nr:protein unc-93 homolog A-like isoform X2 [Mercenaria mercenaria]
MNIMEQTTGDDMENFADHNEYQLLCESKIQEQCIQGEIFSDRPVSDNTTENMRVPENIEHIETTSCETFDNSDTGSWSSDTPLLPGKILDCENTTRDFHDAPDSSEIDKVVEAKLNTVNGEHIDKHVSLDMDQTSIAVPENNDGHTFGSGISIAYSIIRDVERVKTNPVHVFGSGWEFGSVCSINLHGSGDIFRSRTNTTDHHGFHNSPSAGRDTLLSRVFKDKIGSMQFDKNVDKESVKFTTLETNDIPMGVSSPVKTKNLKNLLILSTSLTFLHIAVFGLRNLQSSINSENGLGVFSLATLCGAFMFGSLASPFIVRKYGPKICVSISCFGHLVYIIANNFPSFYVIIPASVVHGLSNALLWNALCTYITEIGLDEAILKSKVPSNVLSRYFGIFFLALQMSMVLGNLISSLILSQADNRIKSNGNKIALSDTMDSSTTSVYSLVANVTGTEIFQIGMDESKCGASHCDVSTGEKAKPSVDDLDKLFLLGTYSSCAIISILVIQCFLDQLPNYSPSSSTLKDIIKQAGSVLAMVIDRKFCFIVMLCLYTVFSNGFVVADVLKAFITCPLGVRMVGYSMIWFGLCGSISSYMFGKLAKYTGNMAAFITASVLNVTSLALMTSWKPSLEDQYLLFAFIGAWGFADGIWQSQINSLISSMFADRYETAFGCCRVLQGLAGIIVFTMSNMMCMMSKIIFTTATCLLSVVLYVVMEIVGYRDRDIC